MMDSGFEPHLGFVFWSKVDDALQTTIGFDVDPKIVSDDALKIYFVVGLKTVVDERKKDFETEQGTHVAHPDVDED